MWSKMDLTRKHFEQRRGKKCFHYVYIQYFKLCIISIISTAGLGPEERPTIGAVVDRACRTCPGGQCSRVMTNIRVNTIRFQFEVDRPGPAQCAGHPSLRLPLLIPESIEDHYRVPVQWQP